jgi:hypothetical protein
MTYMVCSRPKEETRPVVLIFFSAPMIYKLFCNCSMLSQPKSAVHKRAATGDTSKEIIGSILTLKRSTDYLNQGRTGSLYDKNAQLTLLSQHKLAFTGRNIKYVNGSVNSEGHLEKNLKPGSTLIFMSSKSQSARETVPFKRAL